MKWLLDTHILLFWLGQDSRLSRAQKRVIQRAGPAQSLLVSDITLWGIATLCALGRLHLHLPLRDWLEAAVAPPLVQRMGISPAVATSVADLPSSFHRDPADRIIVATAKVFGATLLTQDTRIIEAALVPTLP